MSVEYWEIKLAHEADLVWQVLTDRRLMAEWFAKTDFEPVVGEVSTAYPWPDGSEFPGPFKVEVVRVRPGRSVEMVWRNPAMHVAVGWGLAETVEGSLLVVEHSDLTAEETGRPGFKPDYPDIFGERLGRVLEGVRVAAERMRPEGGAVDPARRAQERRTELVALGVAAVVLVGAVVAFVPGGGLDTHWAVRQETPLWPVRKPSEPGTSPTPAASVSPGTTSGSLAPSVGYAVSSTNELGYIGRVTVGAGSTRLDSWSVTIELQPGTSVTGAWDQVTVAREGDQWTFTPRNAHAHVDAQGEFVFWFQARGSGQPSRTSITAG